MGILSVKSKAISETGRRKFVGVFLSQQINSFLSLYALSKQTTKSMIVRDQMDEWYRAKRVINTTEGLIKEIVDRIELPEFDSSIEGRLEKEGFKKTLQIELLKRGISPNDITAILTALDRKS